MRTPRTAAAALALALLAGCGGGGAARPQQDDDRIAALVAGTPDKAMSPALARDHFATVPPAAELAKYSKLTFEAAGGASVSGESATVPVRVLAADGAVRGEVTWELVKAGDQWKLKSAPLP